MAGTSRERLDCGTIVPLSTLRLAALATVLTVLLGACALDSSATLPTDGSAVADSGAGETGVADSGDGPPMDSSLGDSSAPDSGLRDTGSLESGPADTGSADTGPADTGPADTGPPDTGPADTGTPDTGTPDTGAPPPTCDALFGAIRNYLRCDAAETASACEFYSDPSSNMTCTELCATASETCIDTWDEGPSGDRCTHSGSRSGCSDVGNAYLCRCTRPTI